jgi:hypothetical protein
VKGTCEIFSRERQGFVYRGLHSPPCAEKPCDPRKGADQMVIKYFGPNDKRGVYWPPYTAQERRKDGGLDVPLARRTGGHGALWLA